MNPWMNTACQNVINLLFYAGLDKEAFGKIEDRMYARNMQTLRTSAWMVTVLGFVYVFVSLFVPVGNVWLYGAVSICGAVILLLRKRFQDSHSSHTLLISHFLLFTVAAYGITLSFLSGNEAYPSTSVVVFLTLVPLVILDKPLRMYLVITVYSLVFLILSFRFKPGGVFLRDLTNVLTCVFLGMIVFTILNKVRVREIYHTKKMEDMNESMTRALATAIDAKDRYTRGHSQRVADYSLLLSKRMGMSEQDQELIYHAGLLHDIGKIRVPENIINKTGRLTEEEFAQIKVHPSSGYHILGHIEEDVRIGYATKYHHERYDGNGYPNGLAGENIPLFARIIAVADSYDAMASNRSYRKALPQSVIRDELIKGRGTQFDPEIADVMLAIMEEDKEYKLREKQDRGNRVLIIDDDPVFLRFGKMILQEMENLSVICAQTQTEAMNVIENMEVDLILLDLLMPDIDGFSLYKKICEKHRIPTILMTGDKSKETLETIKELKIDDYITKPLNAFITRETVYGVLRSYDKT